MRQNREVFVLPVLLESSNRDGQVDYYSHVIRKKPIYKTKVYKTFLWKKSSKEIYPTTFPNITNLSIIKLFKFSQNEIIKPETLPNRFLY
jgi:hypothetical protein